MSSTRTVAAPPYTPRSDDATTRRRGLLRGWRPALLIAVRTSWRHRGRTVLICALIALPVFSMSFVDTWFRTQELTLDERLTRTMGRADAVAYVTPSTTIEPPVPAPGEPSFALSGDERDPATVDLATLLPPDTVLAPLATGGEASTIVQSGDRSDGAALVVGGLDSPLAAGMVELQDGRHPAGPDEIALSPGLADLLGVGVDDSVGIAGERTFVVVGLVVEPDCLACATVWVTDDADLGAVEEAPQFPGYLVDLPAGADVRALWISLAAEGVSFVSRDAVLNPDAYQTVSYDDPVDVQVVGAVALIGVFGLLEVVLLAGTAFAVGARRQVRELGWVAASGGTRRDVRLVVLAQGVVLGAVAGVVGAGLGVFAVLALSGPLEQLSGKLFGGVVVRPLDLAGIAAFGVLAATLAAILPARVVAKQPVMAALANSYAPPASRVRRPLLGVGLLLVGATAALGATVRLTAVVDAFNRQLAVSGDEPPAGQDFWQPPSTTPYLAVATVGMCLVVAAALLLVPVLVGAVARFGRYLPLVPRLALRDAGRHRHRTAPAIGAITLVVGGSVALGFGLLADHTKNVEGYVAEAPAGYAVIRTAYDELGQRAVATPPATANAVAAALDARPVPLARAGIAVVPSEVMGDDPGPQPLQLLSTLRCDGYDGCLSSGTEVLVGPIEALGAVSGREVSPAARSTLASGGAVVLGTGVAEAAGTVEIGSFFGVDENEVDAANPQLSQTHRLPATVLEMPRINLGAVFLTPETAQSLGYVTTPGPVVLVTKRAPTADQEEAARVVARDAGADVYVERGYQSNPMPIFVVLGAISGLITLGGIAIAVGLAAAEGRADLATLGAVGAAPRRRRALAMAQAAVVGVLGSILGIALGTFAAVVARFGLDIGYWAVPWPLLGIVGVGVPVLAMAVAGVFTRSRLPMVRRVA